MEEDSGPRLNLSKRLVYDFPGWIDDIPRIQVDSGWPRILQKSLAI